MSKNHQNITLSATITATPKDLEDIGFSAAQVAGAVGLRVTCGDAGDIRYTDSGTTPTATLGDIINSEQTVEANGVGGYQDYQFVRKSADVACTFTLDTFEDV